MKTVGYKQFTEYFNKVPENYKRIDSISDLNTSYYDPTAKKATTIQEIHKRKKRYCFNLTIPTNNTSAKKHIYYYDSKEEAQKHHKQLKAQLYDQLTKPYLKKIERGRKLTIKDEETLIEIMNSF